MVYLKHWSDFHTQAVELYKREPGRTRYLIKSHPSRQWLVLKVTDDVQTLKYRSRSTVILNRFESFNRELNALMAGVSSGEESAAAAGAVVSAVEEGVSEVAQAVTGAADMTNATTQSSSSKKKKKKGGGKK